MPYHDKPRTHHQSQNPLKSYLRAPATHNTIINNPKKNQAQKPSTKQNRAVYKSKKPKIDQISLSAQLLHQLRVSITQEVENTYITNQTQ